MKRFDRFAGVTIKAAKTLGILLKNNDMDETGFNEPMFPNADPSVPGVVSTPACPPLLAPLTDVSPFPGCPLVKLHGQTPQSNSAI
jgi:hypothetical protein